MAATTAPDLRDFDVILVNSSGGKDSQAMLDYVAEMARAAGVADRVVVLHCDLGKTPQGNDIEWPGTAELAAEQAGHYGFRFEVRRREQGDLLTQVEQRGMWPSSAARYCTSDQKRGPARRLMTQLVRELGESGRPVRLLNCLGLRAAESTGRARRPVLARDDSASNGKRDVTTWHPIHGWTDAQVWDRIRRSGVRYHEAYDQGMTRLSCSMCVLASRADLVRACQLRPALAAEYADVEQRIGHTFQHGTSMADLIGVAAQPAAEVPEQMALVF